MQVLVVAFYYIMVRDISSLWPRECRITKVSFATQVKKYLHGVAFDHDVFSPVPETGLEKP